MQLGRSSLEGDELRGELKRTGALLEGHFLLSSGLHSPRYIQCARLLQYPDLAGRAGRAVAALFPGIRPGAVLSPALGGVILGHEVARALGVRALFAERVGGEFGLRRGFEIERGEEILLVEDVTTTGKSVGELATVALRFGGKLIGVAALVDRSGGGVSGQGGLPAGIPVRAVLALEVPQHPPELCPSCREGLPVEKPGSRPMPQLPKNT